MSRSPVTWKGLRFAAVGALSRGMGVVNPEWGRRYLVRELARMPGLPAKAAQLLEQKFSPAGYRQYSVPCLPVEWAKAKLLAEAPGLAEQIEEISEEGITASLGQVHWARLRDGREVAIKLQFPQAAEQLEEQLGLLLASLKLVPSARRYGIDLESYGPFLKEIFLRETDYRLEAASQGLFRDAWQPLGGVLVPEPLKELGGRGILVQRFEKANWLESLASSTEEVRAEAARQLGRVVLTGSFRLGMIHGDLHARNWGYREESRELVLYDFGSTLRLDEGMRSALRALFFSGNDSPDSCMGRFGDLGFDLEKLAYISQQLPEVLDLLAEPFRQEGLWQPAKWRISERLDELLGSDRWWFRVAGPPWFLFLMRGWFGAIGAIDRLGTGVDLRALLKEAGVAPGASPPVAEKVARDSASSRHLRIRIREAENVVVDLTLPARVVEDLESTMPDNVATQLVALHIDVRAIKARAIASGFAPQELFEATAGARHYRVWLE